MATSKIKRAFHISNLLLNSPTNLLKRDFNIGFPKPKIVVFSLTDKCNSKCIHCNIWRTKSNRNEMTAQEIGRIFSDRFFQDLKGIILSGGEITLRKDLKEVILEIKKALPKIDLCLSTNAILPDRMINLVKFCAENKIKVGIGISLDGIGEKHDKIRGIPGNFQKVDYLVKELKKLGEIGEVEISLGITISDDTIDSINDVKIYAESMGVCFVPQIAEEAPFYHNIASIKQTNEKILKYLYTLKDTSHRNLCINHFKGKGTRFPCFALNEFFLLQSNGDICPCLKMSNIVAGNLRDKSAYEVWSSNEIKKAKKLVKGCKGCLNTWAWEFSAHAYCFPLVKYNLKKIFGLTN